MKRIRKIPILIQIDGDLKEKVEAVALKLNIPKQKAYSLILKNGLKII